MDKHIIIGKTRRKGYCLSNYVYLSNYVISEDKFVLDYFKNDPIGIRHPFHTFMIHKGDGVFITEPAWAEYMEEIKQECEDFINIES